MFYVYFPLSIILIPYFIKHYANLLKSSEF
jgi:hypothetical protein